MEIPGLIYIISILALFRAGIQEKRLKDTRKENEELRKKLGRTVI